MPGLSTGVESICLLSERGKTSGEHGGEWACVFEHTECEIPGRQFGIRINRRTIQHNDKTTVRD